MTPAFFCSDRGYELIQRFEGLRTTAYQDQGGKWTIGYGHTGPEVVAGLTCTQQEAGQWLMQDVASAEEAVNRFTTTLNLNQNQFDALCDFCYNLGAGALQESMLLKRVNAQLWDEAADEFLRWVYAGGEVSEGLKARRAAERALFMEAV